MNNLSFDNADVCYYKDFLSTETSEHIFLTISNMFDHEEPRTILNVNFEPKYKLNRKTMVFIDSDIDTAIIPKIWGHNVSVMNFPEDLFEVKNKLEQQLNKRFNICLANYYTSKKKSIGWHSDNEEKGDTNCIASLSFGAEREFCFRKIGSNDIYKSIMLHDNSLLVMGQGCQENYQHCLIPAKESKGPRLNLTFRFFDARYINF